jgi:hypothetical protein
MMLYVLDPARFNGYIIDGLCPNCGHKLTSKDDHMTGLNVNGHFTWGCRILTDSKPERPGMVS